MIQTQNAMLSPFMFDQIVSLQFPQDFNEVSSVFSQNQQPIDSQIKYQFSNIGQPKNMKRKNYKKNIIGHIVKKSIRQFLNPMFYEQINDICSKHNEKVTACLQHYSELLQRITGPSHLQKLIVPDAKQEVEVKKVFVEFLEWYLEQRYFRYLILEGRMQNKQIYIDYKNKKLLKLIKELKIKAEKTQNNFNRILQPFEFLI